MSEQIKAFRLNLKMSTDKPKADNLEAVLHRIKELEMTQADLLCLYSTTYNLLQDLVSHFYWCLSSPYFTAAPRAAAPPYEVIGMYWTALSLPPEQSAS